MSIKEEMEKRKRQNELSQEQKTNEENARLASQEPRRRELRDHLMQETQGLQVLIRRNEDGSIEVQPSEAAKSYEFIRIIVYPAVYCLETRKMADPNFAESIEEASTLAELDGHVADFLVRMRVRT
jgi:hypothetical protein